MSETRRAAVIGLGRIGGSAARNLLVAGIETAVYDVNAAAQDALVDAGARGASSAADAATGADLIAVAVLNDEQARAVVSGPDGVLEGARNGAVIAIHSTLTLGCVRELAGAASARGVAVLDAGVSTTGAGDSDKLALFVGGDETALDSVRPIIEAYSRDTRYLGGLGSGMTAKLVRNMLALTLMTAAYEAYAFAETVGMDLGALKAILETAPPAQQMDIVLAVPTTLPITESEAARAHVEAILGVSGDDLDRALDAYAGMIEKDMDEATELAGEAGVELRLAPIARELIRPTLLLPPRP